MVFPFGLGNPAFFFALGFMKHLGDSEAMIVKLRRSGPKAGRVHLQGELPELLDACSISEGESTFPTRLPGGGFH